jgi:hypothetical protein
VAGVRSVAEIKILCGALPPHLHGVVVSTETTLPFKLRIADRYVIFTVKVVLGGGVQRYVASCCSVLGYRGLCKEERDLANCARSLLRDVPMHCLTDLTSSSRITLIASAKYKGKCKQKQIKISFYLQSDIGSTEQNSEYEQY